MTLPILAGDPAADAGARAWWQADGGVAVTGPDGVVRCLPAGALRPAGGSPPAWPAPGTPLHPARQAELAAALDWTTGTGRTPVELLAVLGRMWLARETPRQVRAAIEELARDVQLARRDWEALPGPARELLASVRSESFARWAGRTRQVASAVLPVTDPRTGTLDRALPGRWQGHGPRPRSGTGPGELFVARAAGTGPPDGRLAVQTIAPRRVVGALLAETLPILTGAGPGAPATEVALQPDGRLAVTGPDGRVRRMPAELTDRIRGWLHGRLADGATLHRARAELAAVLGAELTPLPSAAHPRVGGTLTALASLWTADDTPEETRAAVESFVAEVLAADESLRPEQWPVLPPAAQDLVRTSAPARPGPPLDPYAALRPGRHAAIAERVLAAAATLATAAPAGSGGQLAAQTAALVGSLGLVNVLEVAATGLDQRMRSRLESADEAERSSARKEKVAGSERILRDRWAPERRRASEAEAVQERATARCHRRIADAYQRARDLAREAATAYQAVARGLAERSVLAGTPPPAAAARLERLVADATAARDTYQRYQEAVAATQPVALEAAVPPGELPFLGALTGRLNELLAPLAGGPALRPEEVRQLLLARWRWVACPDGAMIPVGAGTVELRIGYEASDPVEVLDPPEQTTQLIVAQLPQFPKGTRVVGTARHFRLGREVGQRLTDWLVPWLVRTVPDGLLEGLSGTGGRVLLGVRELLRMAVARISVGLIRTVSIASTGAALTLPGRVSDNRGPASLYHVAGSWLVQARRAEPGAQWSSPVRVDHPHEGDPVGLLLWVAHCYVDRASTDTIRIDPDRLPAARRFPATYSVASLTGLPELYDRTLEMLGPVGSGARREVADLVWQELPAWLDQSVMDPDLVQRAVYDNGRLIGVVGYRTEVDVNAVRPLGGLGLRHFVEAVLVDFAEYSGTVRQAATGFFSGLFGARLHPDAGGVPAVGLRFAPGRSRHRAHTAYTAAIHPEVRRDTGTSQGILAPLRITVHVKRYDTGAAARSEPVPARAVIRAPVTSLYQYGVPVDAAAARRDEQGNLLTRGGRVWLTDEPAPGPPPGRTGRLADWLGPDHAGGVGPGHVQHLANVEQIRQQVEAWLRDRGWLPPTGPDGWPVLSGDPMVASGELANLRAVREQISALRLEGAFDQVAQDGIPLRLVRHQVNRVPQHLLLWIRVRQDWDAMALLGHTSAQTPVYLEIGAHQFQREAGQARTKAKGFELSSEAGLPGPLAGAVGGLGRLVRRTVSLVWTAAARRHRVLIAEGAETSPAAVFATVDTLEVVHKRDDGSEEPVARGTITGELVMPGGLLAPDPPPPARPPMADISPAVLRQVRVLHASNQGVMAAAQRLTGARPGSAGYEYLAAAASLRTAVANGALLSTGQSAEVVLDPRVDHRRWSPRQARVLIRGHARDLRFVTTDNLTIIDGELAMDIYRRTATFEDARQVEASGQLGLGGRLAAAGGSGARTGMQATSHSRQQISAEETLQIDIGIQYLFEARVEWRLTAVEGRVRRRIARPPRTESVPGTVLLAVPERKALALYAGGELPLPLEEVSDALIRYATGRLSLDLGLLAAVQGRFRADRVTAGLAGPGPGPPAGRPASPPPAGSPPGSPPAGSPPAGGQRLPEHLDRVLGMSWFEPAELTRDPPADQPDPDAELEPLLAAVLRGVETVVPGATDRNPVLRQALAGQLAGDGWRGLLRRMLADRPEPGQAGGAGPEPVTISVDIPYGRYWAEQVDIVLTARLSDAEPVAGDDRLLIRQNYHMDGQGYATTVGMLWGWAGCAAGTAADLSSGVGRGYTSTASLHQTSTEVQRLGALHDGTARYERDLTIDVQVRRRDPRPLQRPARGLVTWLGRTGEPSIAHARLRGRVVQVVARGSAGAPPAASQPPADPPAGQPPADPRPVPLPDTFITEAVEVCLRDRLRPHLVDRLGRDRVAELDPVLASQLSRLSVMTCFRRMAAPQGHPVVELPMPLRPGEPPQLLRVTLHADLTEPRPVAEWDNIELGHDTREETVVSRGLSRDRLLPPGRGAGVAAPAELRGGFFTGQSTSESESQKQGGRAETKVYAVGRGVTVAVRAGFLATLEVVAVLPTGQERVLGREELGLLATGRAYLTVHASSYHQMRTRMATTHPRDAWRWLLDGGPELAGAARGSRLRHWLADRWPGRRTAPLPTFDLGELLAIASHRPDYDPGNPHLAVADDLHRRLGQPRWLSPQMIRLTAGTPAGLAADPLRLAMLLARDRGGDILVDLSEPGGVLRRYRALGGRPGQLGTRLVTDFPDGFAAQRAALESDLVERAHRAGLDLRDLFHQSGADGRKFAEVVRAAVNPLAELPMPVVPDFLTARAATPSTVGL